MKCFIIEDELMAAERLVGLLHSVNEDIQVLGMAQSIKSAVKWLNENPDPELVFMDIQLADGLSFEIFEQVDGDFPVIFTTAYDEYAIQAFKHNSIDYLLKPLEYKSIKTAIDKFHRHHQNSRMQHPVFETMLKNFTQNYKNKFVIKVGDHLKVFPVGEIQCFYSMEKAVFLQHINGRDYALSYTMDQIEELIDPSLFFRISRKYLVASNAIADIISYSNSRLRIELNSKHEKEIIVARERVQRFKDWLEGG